LRPLRVQHETIIRAEIDILKAMNSPFICKLYLHGFSEDSHFLLLEFIEGGDMRKLIYAPGTCFNELLFKYNGVLFFSFFIYIVIYYVHSVYLHLIPIHWLLFYFLFFSNCILLAHN
jgi:serine/threonine protein kinase